MIRASLSPTVLVWDGNKAPAKHAQVATRPLYIGPNVLYGIGSQ